MGPKRGPADRTVRRGAPDLPQRGRPIMQARLLTIYRRLFSAFGPQHWWPARTPFEVTVGAILTQNTAWRNVEHAIAALRRRRLLTPQALRRLPTARLARLIRPAGYFNVKARRLKAFVAFVCAQAGGRLDALWRQDLPALRHRLLSVPGVGPETADSILLYAGGQAVFVVDTYTRRVLARHGLVAPDASYEVVQRLFMDHLPRNVNLYNEFHALFVQLGKAHCRAVPRCDQCPLRALFASEHA